MKINRLLMAVLLASAGAASVSSASAAATTIYISGATTYRAPVTQAILDTASTGILVSGSTTIAYNGSSVYGAGAAIFHGYLKNGGQEVYIKTYWTGAAAGVYDVALPNAFTGWIDSPATITGTIPGTSSSGTLAPAPGTSIPGTYSKTDSHAPDAILSDALATTVANEYGTFDSSVSSAITAAGLLPCGNSTRNPSSTAASKNTVGIAPMVWVVGNSAIAPTFNNISQQAANSLINGPTSAALLSGSSADKNNWVVCIGRNEDSGTRVNTLAESKAGVTTPAGIQQFLPTFTNNQKTQAAAPSGSNPSVPEGGGGSTVNGLGLWPADWTLNTEANIDWFTPGHSGFNGGGDVAACLSGTNPVTGLTFTASSIAGDTGNGGTSADNVSGQPTGYVSSGTGAQKVWFIGYLGVADAIGSGTLTGHTLSSGASVSNGTVLSYNGVTYTGASDIQNGWYTFWCLEHMYYNPAHMTIGSVTKNTVDDIADALFVTYACTNSSGVYAGPPVNAAGVLYNSMNFTKSVEGGVPSTK